MKRGWRQNKSLCKDALAGFLQGRELHSTKWIILCYLKRILFACLGKIYFPERKQPVNQQYSKSYPTTTRSGLWPASLHITSKNSSSGLPYPQKCKCPHMISCDGRKQITKVWYVKQTISFTNKIPLLL